MKPRILFVLVLGLFPGLAEAQAAQRPMEFADVFRTRALESAELSPDGRWVVYQASRVKFPEWERRSDLFLASADGRITRQLTRETADETGPRWHPRGELIGFTSTREGRRRQLFLMRPDGGEAWKVTDSPEAIGAWGWSPDGTRLAYVGGEEGSRQVWLLAGDGSGTPQALTRHPTPVQGLYWSEDGRSLLFLAPDEDEPARRRRMRERFNVQVVDEERPPVHLWEIDLGTRESRRLTEGDYRVLGVELSRDGQWAAFRGITTDRYEDSRASEVYLLHLPSARVEQLTDNYVSEGGLSFSPDSRLLAMSAPRAFTYGAIQRIYVRPVTGGEWRELGTEYDRHASIDFWSDDSRRIYFEGHEGVTRDLHEVDVRTGRVRQVTDTEGVVAASRHRETGTVLLRYTDPHHPLDLYLTTLQNLPRRDRWTRVTRLNPWVDSLQLGRYETVRWRSQDGTEVEGILVYPLNHDPSRRYPLIVQLHGGPAAAYMLTFVAGHGTYPHILAANQYAVFQPNYRGSTGYGEIFQSQIAGDYWPRAFEDIMTGVDHLIERGIAHPDSLGMMGWSAGGHWSNWTLVSTDRFKAISSGAGVANWISLYGQTDVQATREYYLGGDAGRSAANRPWDDFEHWWAESPLKHIRNARTPTLIHFGERDERIPMPQGQELHMALKKLGVPTEFLVYPGQPHGIREPRYQLVKMKSELGWFERWIRGRDSWLDWSELLATAERIGGRTREPREPAAEPAGEPVGTP